LVFSPEKWSNSAVQADFSVELGKDDEALELPWAAPSGEPRYYDLRRQPELLLNVQEAFDNEELGQFLAAINSAHSMLETCKCDTWTSKDLSEEEQGFGGEWKFGSYVDLIFAADEPRYLLGAHEELARSLCKLLRCVPEISSAVELVIRHCHFHVADGEDSRLGFYLTFYLSGYGSDANEARARWNIGLKLVENALLQLSVQKSAVRSQ
jgi:hypothetical protein